MTRNDHLDNLVWNRNFLARIKDRDPYTARELVSEWRGKFDYTAEEIKQSINRGNNK